MHSSWQSADKVGQSIGARSATYQVRCRMQRTAGENVAIAGAMDQLDSLACRRELHRVFTDDVPGAQRCIAWCCSAVLDGKAQRQRRAGRGIQLVFVMRLDDVAIPTR
jgi:hypothetical protein